MHTSLLQTQFLLIARQPVCHISRSETKTISQSPATLLQIRANWQLFSIHSTSFPPPSHSHDDDALWPIKCDILVGKSHHLRTGGNPCWLWYHTLIMKYLFKYHCRKHNFSFYYFYWIDNAHLFLISIRAKFAFNIAQKKRNSTFQEAHIFCR